MALSETLICNAALAKIGAKRINDYADDTESGTEARYCRTHYEMTRDALLRSHWWRFASGRAVLSRNTTSPTFEWTYQFHLPNDFLRMKSIYENRINDENLDSYVLEGDQLLTEESSMSIRYIKRITDVSKFDPLFVDALVLLLAIKLAGPLSGGNAKLIQLLQMELDNTLSTARLVNAVETNTIGQYDLETWNDARY